MDEKIVRQTPLQLAVGAECSRRHWSFDRFFTALQASCAPGMKRTTKTNWAIRIGRLRPSDGTTQTVASALGMSLDDLYVSMLVETRKTLAAGIPVIGDLVISAPVDSKVFCETPELTYGTPEFAKAVKATKAALKAQGEGHESK